MFSQFFTYGYLFDSRTSVFSRSDKIFFFISVALLIFGVLFLAIRRFVKNPLSKVLIGKWLSLFWTIGILGLIWSALRHQQIQTISARIIVAVLYVTGIAWVAYILRYYFKAHRQQKAEYEKEQLKRKYL